MADIKDWAALSKPDPEWEEVVRTQMGGKAFSLSMFPDIQSLRMMISMQKKNMSAQMGGGIAGVKEQDHQVSVRDGSTITCRVYQRENPPSGGSPLAVIFHGGGWCIGGLENEELLCRLLTSKLGMTCVNVDYRLAPEHPFPAGPQDCYDATKWAAANAASLGADPSKGFIVGGTSAGGNMAAVVAHLGRDEGLTPPLTGCHLMIPLICDARHIPEKYRAEYQAWEQNKDAAILDQAACFLFQGSYIPNAKDYASPLFSPLLFETGQKGFPPTSFQVCGADPLRDDVRIFERILREDHGIKTRIDAYPGLPHGFWSIVPTMKASQKFVADSVKGVEWLLQQKA